METKSVKNISGQSLTVADFGIVEAGATITVPISFHNANFEESEDQTAKKEKAITSKHK